MPVHLRNFYYSQLVKLKEQENKRNDQSSSKPPPKAKVDKPF